VLRHLCLGHNLVEVSREAGHSSIKITVDAYYHRIPDNAGENMDQPQQNATYVQPIPLADDPPEKFLQ
jgi:hypothetical protein